MTYDAKPPSTHEPIFVADELVRRGDLLSIEAAKVILDLNSELRKLTQCDECGGNGIRWYSFRGHDTCLKCKGTGKR